MSSCHSCDDSYTYLVKDGRLEGVRGIRITYADGVVAKVRASIIVSVVGCNTAIAEGSFEDACEVPAHVPGVAGVA